MALSSMTGFARSHGVSGTYAWSWELKSVNAKGLELRLRIPPGWDAIEVPVRAKAAETLSRGNVYAKLTVNREGAAPVVRINEPVLAAVLAAIKNLSGRVDAERPRLDGVLGLKGVVEVIDEEESEDSRRAAEGAIVAGFVQALGRIVRDAPARGRRARKNPRRPPRRNRGVVGAGGERCRAASRTRSRRKSPNRSRCCSMRRAGSIPTGCIRKRS